MRKDKLSNKKKELQSRNQKSVRWEINHRCILNYIHEYVKDYYSIPTITDISKETGLSRPTVYKHLSDTTVQDYLGKQFNTFSLLIPEILGMLYSKSFNPLASDMETIRAAKTILEFLQFSSKYSNYITIHEKINYLIINNTTITQDQLKSLAPEQLSQIEYLIMDAQRNDEQN